MTPMSDQQQDEKEPTDPHEAFQQEAAQLKLERDDAVAKTKRALADLENARRRMEEEKNAFAAFATQAFIIQMLELYDNFHRLLTHQPEIKSQDESMKQWLKGLELIDQQFQSFLERQGVKRTTVQVGEKIDPQKHEAVMSGEGEEGVILEVFSVGYEMRGRVIQTAKVKVGKG